MAALRLATRRGGILIPRPVARISVRSLTQNASPNKDPNALPPNFPHENYAVPAAHAVSTLGRIVKYVAAGAVGLGVTAVVAFEGMHYWVENVALSAPSRSDPNDLASYGWEDENVPFTGGMKGGTDPRLGWKARHALRGAWIAWEWGAGQASVIHNRSLHPEISNRSKSLIRKVAPVDRGYEMAAEYIDVAIAQARAKGLVFPDEMDPTTPNPPSLADALMAEVRDTRAPPDPTALDLLSLKAAVLERMNTPDTLAHAKELYERVLSGESQAGLPIPTARCVRLAHKIGDLAQRTGDEVEAQEWWSWGLRRVGIELPVPTTARVVKSSSWWRSSSKPTEGSTVIPTPPILPPPVLRAVTSILIAFSAADAQAGKLDRAAAVQAYTSQFLFHAPRASLGKLDIPTPMKDTAPATLQSTWEASRLATLDLHVASVAHARNDTTLNPLDLASNSTEQAEGVLSLLTPTIPTAYTTNGSKRSSMREPVHRLVRDTIATGAEAYYTQAILLERGASTGKEEDRVHRLEHSSECFERAMSLAAAESNTTDRTTRAGGEEDAVGRGEEWVRYYRGYVRTREKIMVLVGKAKE